VPHSGINRALLFPTIAKLTLACFNECEGAISIHVTFAYRKAYRYPQKSPFSDITVATLEVLVTLLHAANQGEALSGRVLVFSFFFVNQKNRCLFFFFLLGLTDIPYDNRCLILSSAKSLVAISDPMEFFLRVLHLTFLLEI